MATDRVKSKDKKANTALEKTVTPRKSSRISEQAVKRKATEDVSPASTKKRKPVEKPIEGVAGTKLPDHKKAKSGKKKPQTAPANGSDAAEEGEGVIVEDDDTTKTLVEEIDGGQASEDDDAPGGASLFQPGQDVGKAPAAAVEKATQAKVSSSKSRGKGKPNGVAAAALNGGKTKEGSKDQDGEDLGGVVYVGRIPHGFFEHEMRSYFSQFGDIRRLRLSRNRKTGASKHYAFIEFADRDVAEIVAKTMDNYLLFGHILRCSVVPHEKIPPNLFKGANRRFKPVPWNRMEGRKLALPKSETDWASKISRETRKRAEQAAKLASTLGYEFKAPALKSVDAAEAATDDVADQSSSAAIEEKENRQSEASAKEKVDDAAVAPSTTEEATADIAPTEVKGSKGKKEKGKKSKA